MVLNYIKASAAAGTPIPTPVLTEILEQTRMGAGGPRPQFTEIPGTDSVLAQLGKSAYPVPKTSGPIATDDVFDENDNLIGTVVRVPGSKARLVAPKTVKPRELSPSFEKLVETFGTGVENTDPKKAAAARSNMKRGIDGEHTMGRMTDDQRDDYYTFYGIPMESRPKKATTAAPGAGAKGGAAAKISKDPLTGKYLPKDQAEYDSLPSGAKYVDPNGVEGTKP